jgi:hypothetical protein
VTPVTVKQFLGEFFSIGQISVMTQRNSVWGVDIKRLGFRGVIHSSGGITHMANTHITTQKSYITGFKYIPYQAASFAQIDPGAVQSCDASGILTAVLQQG